MAKNKNSVREESVLEAHLPKIAKLIPYELHECFVVPLSMFWDDTTDEYNYCSEFTATQDKEYAKIAHFNYSHHMVTGFITVPTPQGEWYITYALDP